MLHFATTVRLTPALRAGLVLGLAALLALAAAVPGQRAHAQSKVNSHAIFVHHDDWVRANYVSEDLGGTEAFTMEAFVRPSSLASSQQGVLVFNTKTNGNENMNTLFWHKGRFKYYDSATSYVESSTLDPLEWHHVADGLASGVYFYRVSTGSGRTEARKLVVVR